VDKWFFDRQNTLTETQAIDVILRCTLPGHDKRFAEKYGVSLSCIRHIRCGHTWSELRIRLLCEAIDALNRNCP